MKKTHDYDSTFKTLKSRHKRLFISVINEAFHKNYSMDGKIEVLSSEGFFVDGHKADEESKIDGRETDFLIHIEGDYYLLECQSYDDDSISIRLAEYTFLAARSIASWNQERVVMKMPYFSVIYIKNSENTPRTTTITYQFPDGKTYDYSTENIFLSDLTREEIIERKLYVYIPFYIARYEKELVSQKNYEKAVEDLEYFREQMLQLRHENALSDVEIDDLRDCVNQIVTHITDGNAIEGKVVSVMGGEVFELHSEKIIREATEKVTAQFQKELASRDQQLADRDQQLADRDQQLASRDQQLADNAQQLASKDQQIAELEAQIAELTNHQK